MRKAILHKIEGLMARQTLDAIVTNSPENFGYVAGFVSPSQPLMRHRHAMAILPKGAPASLFCVDMEQTTIQRNAPGVELAVWKEFSEDPMEVLASTLKSKGLDRSKIGLEFDYLPAGDYGRLVRLLPNASFVAVEKSLSLLRQIKTPEEVELLHKLSRIADQAIFDSFAAVRAGDTEMDIAAVLTRRMFELGAENFRMLIVATGERSQLPNVGPTARKLQTGDICRVEIFSVIGGYQAGVCRTAYVQRPSEMAEEIWKLMIECRDAILEQVRPGASCLKVYEDFIARLARMKLPPISFVGHGIGLHLHEDPYLGKTPILGEPGGDALVEENMVLGFEPLCYRTGYGFGVQNKDILHVGASGSRLLSDYTNTDKLIHIQ